jgi:formylglycine-generating enzyme required for sulfatase activity
MSSDGGKSDRVFLSYSSKDKAWADAACAVLEGRGVRCWIAPRDIAPGTEWGAAIIAGIDACRVMVPVGSFRPNPWGVHDLLGNVEEWCADAPRRYVAQDETDPRGDDRHALEAGQDHRVARGGSWETTLLFEFKTTSRGTSWDPGEANYRLGFRVAMRPGVKVQ